MIFFLPHDFLMPPRGCAIAAGWLQIKSCCCLLSGKAELPPEMNTNNNRHVHHATTNGAILSPHMLFAGFIDVCVRGSKAER